MKGRIFETISKNQTTGLKTLAVLLDPDKVEISAIEKLAVQAEKSNVGFFFIGGSLMTSQQLDAMLLELRKHTQLPLVLFPGSINQISPYADAILLLSLISGRNAEFLIGQHVISAHQLHSSGLEILPTGYMLVDGGRPTTASYISNTQPLPANKPDIAAATALAGTLLGLKINYLDAGSGADRAVPNKIIEAVKRSSSNPLIVGGGIRTPEQAWQTARSGADIVVVGNLFEEQPEMLHEMAAAVGA